MDIKALFEKPKNDFPYEKSFVFAGIHFNILSMESLAIEDIEHYIPKELDRREGGYLHRLKYDLSLIRRSNSLFAVLAFKRVKPLQQKGSLLIND